MTLNNWSLEDYYIDIPDPPPYEGPIVGMPILYKVHKIGEFMLVDILREAARCLKAEAELAGVILCLAAVLDKRNKQLSNVRHITRFGKNYAYDIF